VCVSVIVCVCVSAEQQLHATLVSAAKVMRCIQCLKPVSAALPMQYFISIITCVTDFQEVLDLRQDAATVALHFANSVVETVATLLIIIVQMFGTRMGYVKVRQAVQRLEHFDQNEDAHLRSIKIWMWLAIAGGFVQIVVCIVCFFVFDIYVHLGWTVLTNQLCIVTSEVIFGLYSARAIAAVSRINTDQHKVSAKQLMLFRKKFYDAKP